MGTALNIVQATYAIGVKQLGCSYKFVQKIELGMQGMTNSMRLQKFERNGGPISKCFQSVYLAGEWGVGG